MSLANTQVPLPMEMAKRTLLIQMPQAWFLLTLLLPRVFRIWVDGKFSVTQDTMSSMISIISTYTGIYVE